MTVDRLDLLIRTALTPSAHVVTPADLAGDIRQAMLATPQRRPLLGGFLATPMARSGLILIALLLVALVGVLVAGSRRPPPLPPGVSAYHGPPGRTGVMPGPGPIGEPRQDWTVSLGGPLGSLGMPLVQGGLVFTADGSGTITASDETTGAERWRHSGTGRAAGSILIAGGRLIVGDDVGGLTALEPATGQVLWDRTVGDLGSLSMAADGDRLVAASSSGHIYGLDGRTGGVTWTVDAGGPVKRGVAIADGRGFAGAAGGRVTAFDIATGDHVTVAELGPGEITTPAVSDGTLYIAHGDQASADRYQLIAIDAVTGTERWRWRAPTKNRLFVGGVEGATIYPVSEDGTAYAIDRATGLGGPFFVTKGPVGSLTAIVDGVIYIASADQTVYAVDRASGVAIWSFAVNGVPSTPSVIDGRVFVGTDLGKVIAIGGSSASPSP